MAIPNSLYGFLSVEPGGGLSALSGYATMTEAPAPESADNDRANALLLSSSLTLP